MDGRLRVVPAASPFVQSDKPERKSVLKGAGRLRPLIEAPASRAATLSPSAPMALADENAGIDADDLRAYRMSLALQSRSYWIYPAAAQQAGEGGTVEVRVAFSSKGIGWVSLERSSGHRLLDDAAQQMLRAALVSAKQPEALRGKSFSLVMPVVFEPGREAGR
jgi:protein TonB